jgi:hypothetical protein
MLIKSSILCPRVGKWTGAVDDAPCHPAIALCQLMLLRCRIALDDIVQLGWHCQALEGWVAAVRLTAANNPSGGSPYCIAIATGLTGGKPSVVNNALAEDFMMAMCMQGAMRWAATISDAG